MRKFKLINSTGVEYSLMSYDHFLHAPDGLGFDKAISLVRTGESYIPTDEYQEQKVISGEVIFKTYTEYQNFIAYISGADELKLAYMPIDKWYFINCKVQNLTKSEMNDAQTLICNINFACFGTWYEATTSSSTTIVSGDGKKYNYEYNYVYNDSSVLQATIENGSMDSPLKIDLFGPCVNPIWSLYQNGVKLFDGKVNCTVLANQKLVINADPANMEIALYTINNTYVSDQYQNSDFTTERFMSAPPGTSYLTVSCQSGTISATVEVNKLALSV